MTQGSTPPREKLVEESYASSNTSLDKDEKTKKTLQTPEAGSGKGARSHRATANQGTAHVSTEHQASAGNDRKSMSLTASPQSSRKGVEERSASEHSSGDESITALPPPRVFPRSMASKHLPRFGAGISERRETSDDSRAERSTASESHEPQPRKRSVSKLQDPSSTPSTRTTTHTTKTTTTTANTSRSARIGAGNSAMSEASSDSRMERSTASESQAAPSRKRSASQPASPLPIPSTTTTTTTASKAVTTPTSTNTTTITVTTGIKTSAKTPADLKSPLARQIAIAERTQAMAAFKDPREILRRAQIRDALFAGLLANDFPKVTSILNSLPSVQSLLKYFPPACPRKWNTQIASAAKSYTNAHGHSQLNLYVSFTAWKMNQHQKMVARVQWDRDMRKLNPQAVEDVCCALASTPEEDVQKDTKMLVATIKTAMKTKNLEKFLASQPFAELKLLDMKCRLLGQYTASATVRKFHAILVQAKELQVGHGAPLAHALLKESPQESEWKPLLCINFAAMSTTTRADFLGKKVTWVQLETLCDTVNGLHRRAVAASANGDSWDVTMLALLKWRLNHTYEKLEDADDAY